MSFTRVQVQEELLKERTCEKCGHIGRAKPTYVPPIEKLSLACETCGAGVGAVVALDQCKEG